MKINHLIVHFYSLNWGHSSIHLQNFGVRGKEDDQWTSVKLILQPKTIRRTLSKRRLTSFLLYCLLCSQWLWVLYWSVSLTFLKSVSRRNGEDPCDLHFVLVLTIVIIGKFLTFGCFVNRILYKPTTLIKVYSFVNDTQ